MSAIPPIDPSASVGHWAETHACTTDAHTHTHASAPDPGVAAASGCQVTDNHLDNAHPESAPKSERLDLDTEGLLRFGSDFDLGPTASQDLSTTASVDKVLPRVSMPNIDAAWLPPAFACTSAQDSVVTPPMVDTTEARAPLNTQPTGIIPVVMAGSSAADAQLAKHRQPQPQQQQPGSSLQPTLTSAASLPPPDAEGGL